MTAAARLRGAIRQGLHLSNRLRRRRFPRPSYRPAPSAPGTFAGHPLTSKYYGPVMLNPGTVLSRASSPEAIQEVQATLALLEPDEYIHFLSAYLEEGTRRYGADWNYSDILTVLWAGATLIHPRSYLEIGVRRGRSAAIVAHQVPECRIVGVDQWIPDYAGMPNPGPDFVRGELVRAGHRGELELLTGNSHEVLPRYFASRPEVYFDLICVDGDHTPEGAAKDLQDVLPHLSVGGMVVFDDMSHPAHPELPQVWSDLIVTDPHFKSGVYRDLGYGVAFAIRVG